MLARHGAAVYHPRAMADKLDSGDPFPNLRLQLVDGTALELPGGLDARYKVILFYRGHW